MSAGTITDQLPAVVGGGGIAPIERPGGVPHVRAAIEELKLIRTFVANELRLGVDYGVVPGTNGKNTLFLPGAQKIAMYFNTFPDYTVVATDMGAGHVEYLVTTRLISRSTGGIVGGGVGSCSTMEKKYRWRGSGRKCPNCQAVAIIKSKYKPGFYCNTKGGGCGSSFGPKDAAICDQADTPAENPDIHDVRNTVLKMAKKRSLVDAAHGLGCLSELFTQDLEENIYDLEAEAEAEAPPPARGYDAEPAPRTSTTDPAGSPADDRAYKEWAADYCRRANEQWTARHPGLGGDRDLVRPEQLHRHLYKALRGVETTAGVIYNHLIRALGVAFADDAPRVKGLMRQYIGALAEAAEAELEGRDPAAAATDTDTDTGADAAIEPDPDAPDGEPFDPTTEPGHDDR